MSTKNSKIINRKKTNKKIKKCSSLHNICNASNDFNQNTFYKPLNVIIFDNEHKINTWNVYSNNEFPLLTNLFTYSCGRKGLQTNCNLSQNKTFMLLALQNHIYEYDLKKNIISLEIELPDELKINHIDNKTLNINDKYPTMLKSIYIDNKLRWIALSRLHNNNYYICVWKYNGLNTKLYFKTSYKKKNNIFEKNIKVNSIHLIENKMNSNTVHFYLDLFIETSSKNKNEIKFTEINTTSFFENIIKLSNNEKEEYRLLEIGKSFIYLTTESELIIYNKDGKLYQTLDSKLLYHRYIDIIKELNDNIIITFSIYSRNVIQIIVWKKNKISKYFEFEKILEDYKIIELSTKERCIITNVEIIDEHILCSISHDKYHSVEIWELFSGNHIHTLNNNCPINNFFATYKNHPLLIKKKHSSLIPLDYTHLKNKIQKSRIGIVPINILIDFNNLIKIGEGSYNSVHKALINERSNYENVFRNSKNILIRKSLEYNTMCEAIKECEYFCNLSKINIAPKIYDIFLQENNKLVMIMEKYDQSFENYLNKYTVFSDSINNQITKELLRLFLKAHQIHLLCSDINPRNIVMRYTNYNVELSMIDVDFLNCIQYDLPEMFLLRKPKNKKNNKSKKYSHVSDILDILDEYKDYDIKRECNYNNKSVLNNWFSPFQIEQINEAIHYAMVCIFAMHLKLDYKCPNFLSPYLKNAFLIDEITSNDDKLKIIYKRVKHNSLRLFKNPHNVNKIVHIVLKYIDHNTENLKYYFPDSSFQDIIDTSMK